MNTRLKSVNLRLTPAAIIGILTPIVEEQLPHLIKSGEVKVEFECWDAGYLNENPVRSVFVNYVPKVGESRTILDISSWLSHDGIEYWDETIAVSKVKAWKCEDEDPAFPNLTFFPAKERTYLNMKARLIEYHYTTKIREMLGADRK